MRCVTVCCCCVCCASSVRCVCLQISESEGLDAGTRKALRLSTKYKDYEAEGGPMSYLAATSKWAHLLQSGERPNHKSKCKRAQAQAATAAAAKQGSWLEAAVSGEGQVARL